MIRGFDAPNKLGAALGWPPISLSGSSAKSATHPTARDSSRRRPAAADVRERLLEDLSAGIALRPGKLRIAFCGAEDLAAKLLEISQAMANDGVVRVHFCTNLVRTLLPSQAAELASSPPRGGGFDRRGG